MNTDKKNEFNKQKREAKNMLTIKKAIQNIKVYFEELNQKEIAVANAKMHNLI